MLTLLHLLTFRMADVDFWTDSESSDSDVVAVAIKESYYEQVFAFRMRDEDDFITCARCESERMLDCKHCLEMSIAMLFDDPADDKDARIAQYEASQKNKTNHPRTREESKTTRRRANRKGTGKSQPNPNKKPLRKSKRGSIFGDERGICRATCNV